MADIAHGCKFFIGSSQLNNVINIDLPKAEATKVDITTLGQTSNYKQYRAGMFEGGMLSVESLWSAADYATVLGDLGTVLNFKVQMNDATPTNYTFGGFISEVGEMQLDIGSDKPTSFKFSVTVNGAVTIS